MLDPVFIAKSLGIRQGAAEIILGAPALYKVCEGCEGIAKVDQFLCPVCKAYRFDPSLTRLTAACETLSAQPFPSYPATTPRLPGFI